MAKCDSFHTQLTTIMDIMTKTALAQICRLFEEDSASLRKEMSRVVRENKVLHDQLRCLEHELAIVRQAKKEPHKRAKAYHNVGIQTGETHRGVEKDNTGVNRAPSINGIFGKEWCINLWNDGETQGCNPADAEPRSDFVEECREGDQVQIEQLTIKEEESEVDINERNQQMLEAFTKEGATWVSDRSETSSTDRHFTDAVRRGGHSVSADSSDDFESLLESPGISRGQHTEFISLDGTTGDYTIMPTAAVSPDYDPHCVPIEYEYEGIEGERELVAFEGVSEIATQTVFVKTEATSKTESAVSESAVSESAVTESAETFGYFDRFDLQQAPKRRNKFHCKLCSKKYVKYSTLKTHMRGHKRDKIHRCRVCKSVFPQKNLLRTHKCSVVQNDVKKKIQNNNNNNSSSSSSSSNNNNNNNKAKGKNCCEYCGRVFTTNANLRVHYAVHTGERPHKCDICGKTFTQKGNMNIHRRIHTGEKPFSCPVCHKSFSQKINLRHHVVTHGKKYAIKKVLKKKTKNDDDDDDYDFDYHQRFSVL